MAFPLEALTTLSNEEVIHEEVNSKLFYIKYRIVGSKDSISVATTRPRYKYLQHTN